MAASKVSALTELAAADVDRTADFLAIVDTGAGSTKKVKPDSVLGAGTAGQSVVMNSGATGYTFATLFTTGDVKLTLKPTADTGWVLMDDGTIGDASSSATTRANADTENLFTLLWNNTADAQCAVSGGRGANAAADFAAHKTLALPKALGRALATYGSGSGLTARALALATGAETVALASNEWPGTFNLNVNGGSQFTVPTSTSASAHANMQPTLFLNTMIKL